MASFALLFGMKCSADSDEAVSVSKESKSSEEEIYIPKDASVLEVYLAMAENGYNDEDIIRFFADSNSPYLETYVKSRADELGGGVDSSAPVFDPSFRDDTSYKSLYPDMYTDIRTDIFPSDSGSVYLTFCGLSDGTAEQLDALDAHGIKAVFFADTSADPEVIAEIHSRGHTLGILCPENENADAGEKLAEVYEIFIRIKEASGSVPTVFLPADTVNRDALSSEMIRRGFICCRSGIFADLTLGEDVTSDAEKAVGETGRAVICADGRCSGADTEDFISGMEEEGFLFSDPLGAHSASVEEHSASVEALSAPVEALSEQDETSSDKQQ